MTDEQFAELVDVLRDISESLSILRDISESLSILVTALDRAVDNENLQDL